MSELIITYSQGGAKHSAASLDWIQITVQLWLLSPLPGNVWMFILKSAHMLHRKPNLCALRFREQVELRHSIYVSISLCVPFTAVFHEYTAYPAEKESVIFHFPQIMFRSPHFAVLYFI